MMTQAQAILEFRKAAQQPIRDHPTVNIPLDEKRLALDLILEELLELADALGLAGRPTTADEHMTEASDICWEETDIEPDVIAAADAFGDLMVVVGQLGPTLGMNADAVFEEVHASNMSKVDPATGVMPLKPNGKAGKGPNFREPDMERALLATPIGESVDDKVNPEVDVVICQSVSMNHKAIAVTHPHLAYCHMIPATRWNTARGPIRDVYIMPGVETYPSWEDSKKHLESVMESSGLGGKVYYL